MRRSVKALRRKSAKEQIMSKFQLPKTELDRKSLIIRVIFTAVALLGCSVYFIIDPNTFLSQRISADGFFVLAVCLVLLLFSSLFFLFKSKIKSDVVLLSSSQLRRRRSHSGFICLTTYQTTIQTISHAGLHKCEFCLGLSR